MATDSIESVNNVGRGVPDDMLAELGAPFPRSSVHWRIGRKSRDGKSATVLAYIDARDVMERLDEVVGPADWQSTYTETPKRLLCTLSIKVNGEWVGKTDGAGDTNIEGEKGGISDALKRAAVCWNIGRYLYRCPKKWVTLDEKGKLPVKFGQAEILAAAESAFSSPQTRKKAVKALREGLAEGNCHIIRETWDEMNSLQHGEIWRQFVSNERTAIKAMLDEARAAA